MTTVEVFVTGDKIGRFADMTPAGNYGNGAVTLTGVLPLGSILDLFRVVVTGVGPDSAGFCAGQVVAIHAWPETTQPSRPLYAGLTTLAGSATHQILTGPARIVLDLHGILPGTQHFGPRPDPQFADRLAFDNLSITAPGVPCFAKGTLIETEIGPLPVETLRVGDKVGTADHGLQSIRRIGRRDVSGQGPMAPVVIEAGAVGNYRRLRLSPHHRILPVGTRLDLVAAKALVNGTTIRQVPCPQVTTFQMMFDQTEIVFAEGIPTQCLHPGAQADPAGMARAANDAPAGTGPTAQDGRLTAPRQASRTGVRSSAA